MRRLWRLGADDEIDFAAEFGESHTQVGDNRRARQGTATMIRMFNEERAMKRHLIWAAILSAVALVMLVSCDDNSFCECDDVFLQKTGHHIQAPSSGAQP